MKNQTSISRLVFVRVTRLEADILLLSYVANHNITLFQIDVKSVLLNCLKQHSRIEASKKL